MNDLSLCLKRVPSGKLSVLRRGCTPQNGGGLRFLAGYVAPPIAHAIDDGCILLRMEFWEPVPPLIKSYLRNRTCPPFRGDDSSMQLHLQHLSPDYHAAYALQDIHRAPFGW